MNRPAQPFTRRNGRLAACDPCRSRKVACDHSLPVCNRCRKRNQSSQCTYPDSTGYSSPPSTHAQAQSGRQSTASAFNSGTSSIAKESPLASPEITPASAGWRPGYLGYTSYNNTFEETESALALLSGSTAPITSHDRRASRAVPEVSFHDLPKPLRESCLLVLSCLPGQVNEEIEFPKTPEPTRAGWAHIAVHRIVQTLKNDFGPMQVSGQQGLEKMADFLCKNTAQPIRDHAEPHVWLGQLYGPNLRWEAIGLMWAHLVGISDIVDAMRDRSLKWKDGKESLRTAHINLSYCVEISRQLTEANDILLDICRRRSTLLSIIEGDARISSFSSHGTSVSLLTYLGLHALENGTHYIPSLCSENKRRLIAQIFTSDKIGITFAGRPPFISRRYCSTPLPLDISDEDLAADPETLMEAVRNLGDQGWNTSGDVYPVTVIRGRRILSHFREEVVEIALGKAVQSSPEELLDIKLRHDVAMGSLPPGLHYNPDDLLDEGADITKIYIQIVIRLEYLWTKFFIDRMLLKHGHEDGSELLVTSFEMVALTLKIWTHKDRFHCNSMVRNFEWLVMSKGAPGGGILCQELLYPTFTGVHPKHSGLTRSSIVQNLSLLVGFLDWIRPSAPNGDLCADCKAVIQRVLDHHLNGQSQSDNIFQGTDLGMMAQPDFNFQLLDTFEWLRTDNAI